MHCGHKLNCAHKRQSLIDRKVEFDTFDEVNRVDFDVNEHVQHFDASRLIDRNQATVTVVHEQISAQSFSCVVIYTTCTVCDLQIEWNGDYLVDGNFHLRLHLRTQETYIAHYNCIRFGESFNDIADYERK